MRLRKEDANEREKEFAAALIDLLRRFGVEFFRDRSYDTEYALCGGKTRDGQYEIDIDLDDLMD